MFLYNITYNIDRDIENEWMDWMKEVHLYKIMTTGYFESYKFYKLLNIDDEGITYSLQLFATDLSKIEQYLKNDAPSLMAGQNERFRYKHVAFMTVLQEVEL
jgi:hypothetical protein